MIKEVPESSVVSTVLRGNVDITTELYQKTELYVSLPANSAYYIDLALVTADGPFRHKMTYSGTLYQSGFGRMFQREMQSGLYSEYSITNEYSTSVSDESVEVRGLLFTATAGVLVLQVRAEKDGSVQLASGSYLIARSLPGIGGQAEQSAERLLLEDGSIVLLETGYSVLKE